MSALHLLLVGCIAGAVVLTVVAVRLARRRSPPPVAAAPAPEARLPGMPPRHAPEPVPDPPRRAAAPQRPMRSDRFDDVLTSGVPVVPRPPGDDPS